MVNKNIFVPMLSGIVDLEKLIYPVYVQCKLDGHRCLLIDGILYSRKMEVIRNKHLQEKFGKYTEFPLDGELLSNISFEHATSIINSYDAPIDEITYNVYDVVADIPFIERLEIIESIPNSVITFLAKDEADIELLWDKYVTELKYEGLMFRSIESPYKRGRSTTKEGYLLKYKKFLDAEATIIEVVERLKNNNAKTIDNVGKAKRSSAKAGKTPAGMVGSFKVYNELMGEFSVAKGCITNDIAKEIFESKEDYIGKRITFKYQELTKYGKPRFPTFERMYREAN